MAIFETYVFDFFPSKIEKKTRIDSIGIQTHLAPQNDHQHLSFVKDIYVVGQKVTKNGCKMAKLKSCHFFIGQSLYESNHALQSLTGKYREIQGKPCNENRDSAMRTGVSCNEYRVFPVGIGLQGVPCKPYRVWVCSVCSICISFSKVIIEKSYGGRFLWNIN